jgi:hypothetical protein
MRVLALPALLLALSAAACDSLTGPSSSTGLSGTMLRGPIQPVCAASQTCDAPFSSGFTILKLGTIVGSFRSDTQGHYEVRLPAGGYTIVPDADAPIMTPRSQSKDVTVGSSGMTMLDLRFDTGIR